MPTDYHSFLICFHPGHTDVFRNGLPLGVIRGKQFTVHANTMPDGTKVPVEIPPTLPGLVAEVVDLLASGVKQL